MSKIKIGGNTYGIADVFPRLTVEDCFVVSSNKVGRGNGEAKFYFAARSKLFDFLEGKNLVDCVLLKSDLLTFLQMIRKEYYKPSLAYRNKGQLKKLWAERKQLVDALPDEIYFKASVQGHLSGDRGYVKSDSEGFDLIRQLSLPYVSYVSIMKLSRPRGRLFYWKLFVDYNIRTSSGREPYALVYGKKRKTKNVRPGRVKRESEEVKSKRSAARQAKFRKLLLEECFFCPITRIVEEKLLIASHIKPVERSTPKEEIDPKNGFMLSPLYDRLFDQGFITFDSDKAMRVSCWLKESEQKKCNIHTGQLVPNLPLDDEREHYLQYHRQFVFKG